MGEKEAQKELKMIPQIQKMVDSYKNTFIEHIDYTQYIDMFRKVLDSNNSGEVANNSQGHTTLAMLMMLERAKKQVYIYTDALSKNFLDDNVLKALIWASYHNVDVHMMFRGKLPEQSILSQQKRYLWDTVKLTSKTFKSVTDNAMKESLKEIFLVDNNDNVKMRKILTMLLCSVCLLTAKAQTIPNMYRNVDQAKMNHWVDSVFDKMSYDERIGQLFMVISEPKSDNRTMQRLMRYVNEIKLGGILFHKGNPVTQAEVTNRLQKASRVPMFVSLDGEWGLSMRLSGTTRFPKNMMLGAIEDDKLITEYGKEVARQCKEMGIQINFAPDIDVNSNTDNPVIGLRSFGENPRAVADKGIAYARGLETAGIISVAKHFPGNGDTSDDSHNTLPAVHHDRARLDSVELYPFKRYIYDGYAGVMTGHLYVPALDKTRNLPSSFSRPIVTGLLQEELGFRGLCFTDALAMKGATTKKSDNPSVKALLAGNDILLAPAAPINDFTAVKEAIDEGILSIEDIEAKCIKKLQY